MMLIRTVLLFILLGCALATAADPCRITVVDRENGWPVPLVELKTTHHVRMVTDNAGVIALDAPELMGKEIWLSVRGHGYSVPADGFGYRGVRVTPKPGGTLTIEVNRELPAKRLGRITGVGLFAESQKLGEYADWQDQGVVGCDSVQNARYRGGLFWIWGDTALAHYPLGRFHTTGATTKRRPLHSLQPPVRLRYNYFEDGDGLPRDLAEFPGKGPTWLSGLLTVLDDAGQEQLVATYSKIKPPLENYERGLCKWNEEKERFEPLKRLWFKSAEQPEPPPTPHGHPVFWTDDAQQQWILFGDPFPTLKCRATFADWSDPAAWVTMQPDVRVPTRAGGDEVEAHRGAIAWSPYRNRWITIFTQLGGKRSYLGELWYAEADTPMGPWRDAIHIVTHEQYSFYNPKLHMDWTTPESPVLLFEATYTRTFSKSNVPTARYDYNQILYRLDLDRLPTP